MNYYNEIKNKLIDNEVYKKVKDYSKNRNDLTTYYEVGRLLIEAQGGEKRAKYGDNLIKEYDKLNSYFCGIRNMKKLPDAMVIVDPKKERIAIRTKSEFENI